MAPLILGMEHIGAILKELKSAKMYVEQSRCQRIISELKQCYMAHQLDFPFGIEGVILKNFMREAETIPVNGGTALQPIQNASGVLGLAETYLLRQLYRPMPSA